MNPHQGTPTTSRFGAGLRWGAGLTGAIACFWLGTPAQGSTLNDWQFDPQTQQLTVVLPDGVTPNYFLLAEPARIVLNLPSTELGAVQPAQYYSGPIQSIRVSQFDAESARVVVEFSPNTVLDPRHAELSSNDLAGGTQWTLRPLVVASPAGTTVSLAPNSPSTSPATVAYTAVAGATVQAPTHTANDGIRTDASALIDDGTATVSDQPPNTLPIDPFAAGAGAQVSVPPLADSGVAVAVPPLADLPEVAPEAPAAPAVSVSAPQPQVLAQVSPSPEPDSSEGVTLTVIPAPQPEVAVPPELVAPLPSPVAVTPQILPSQSLPSQTAAPEPIAPVVAPVIEPQPEVTAPAAPSVPPVATSPAPPVTPPATSPVVPPAVETPEPSAAPIAPPFLAGTAAANAASATTATPTERRTIPPPPDPAQPEGTIPFGAPLPDQAKSATEGTAIAVAPSLDEQPFLPVGTVLSLQYPGSVPLVLDRVEPWNEVLILAEDVVDAQTGQLLLASGTQVLGQFEGFDHSGRRFVVQSVVASGENQPLLAESPWLLGTRNANGGNIATNSGLGAAVVTILSGFSGIGLLGGAALGAATTYATGPQLVTIQPGQIIVVEVVNEVLPFQ